MRNLNLLGRWLRQSWGHPLKKRITVGLMLVVPLVTVGLFFPSGAHFSVPLPTLLGTLLLIGAMGGVLSAFLAQAHQVEDHIRQQTQQMTRTNEDLKRLFEKRMTLEEEIRNSHVLLDSIIENIPHMIFVKDAENLRFVLFNKAGEELLGFPRMQMIGKNDHDFFPSIEADFFTGKDRIVLQGKKLVDIPEERIHTKLKGVRLLHTKKIPILDASGQPRYLLGISEDITERKELEERVMQSEKMSAVGQLAAGVAHELNNPLAIILGFTQSLLKRRKQDDSDTVPLETIEREAARCKKLVQELLMFSRQKGSSLKELFDLEPVLSSAVSLIETQARIKSVDVRMKNGAEGLKIDGSKNQIEQVLINLANNAIDAMPHGGILTIEANPVTKEGETYAEILVADTGEGISEDIQKRIFEPFFTTKEPGKGTGLGLSLVYEIVSDHNGLIKFTSQIGQGTTFNILLPSAK